MAERLLRMDMHSHTRASHDCLCPPERVLATARERGIDRLVVTDTEVLIGDYKTNRPPPHKEPTTAAFMSGGLVAKTTYSNVQGVGPGAVLGVAIDRSAQLGAFMRSFADVV